MHGRHDVRLEAAAASGPGLTVQRQIASIWLSQKDHQIADNGAATNDDVRGFVPPSHRLNEREALVARGDRVNVGKGSVGSWPSMIEGGKQASWWYTEHHPLIHSCPGPDDAERARFRARR